MRVLFLIRALTFGGAERQLVALARGLHARGHQVRVAVFYAGGPLEADLREAGVPVTVLDKGGRWDIAKFLLRLASLLARERPDVIHGYLAMPNALAVLLKPVHRARVVWGLRASERDETRYEWTHRLDSWLQRGLAVFPDLIIANSHAGAEHALREGYPEARLIVIPNGIDTDRFAPQPDLGLPVRQAWGIGPDERLIGRVGRIDPQKDYPTFLRAAAKVLAARPATRFVCVGSGDSALEESLRQLAHSLGIAERVIWAGPRGDMPAVYNALDLLVSSSIFGEGTPNVVAEAMACGIPCVVTDVGDSARVVGDPRRVVPAGDADALAQAILAQLDAIEAGSVDRAAIRRRIVAEYSLEGLIARTEAALAPLVREWRPA
ncbi:MAG TPA: glycosyltransferase [Thermomicrobiales bacterium]|jgi:glycosyltransferase involved in cell wall biosynthesis